MERLIEVFTFVLFLGLPIGVAVAVIVAALVWLVIRRRANR